MRSNIKWHNLNEANYRFARLDYVMPYSSWYFGNTTRLFALEVREYLFDNLFAAVDKGDPGFLVEAQLEEEFDG